MSQITEDVCKNLYPHAESDDTSIRTFFCTLAIVPLAILIEVCAHAWSFPFDNSACCKLHPNWVEPYSPDGNQTQTQVPTEEYNRGRFTAIATLQQPPPSNPVAAPPSSPLSSPPKPPQPPFQKHNHRPSPHLRANRFAAVTLLMVPMCIAFSLRMSEIDVDYLEECKTPLDIKPHNWWAIFFFNILPFSTAAIAWLRTVVDCITVRYHPESGVLDNWWLPCLPIFFGLGIFGTIAVMLRDAMVALMRPNGARRNTGVEDVELALRRDVSEEEQGLMRGDDGDDDRTMYSPRTSSCEDKERSSSDKGVEGH